MVPKENKNNAYAKFGGTNKEHYGIIRNGLFAILVTNRDQGWFSLVQNRAHLRREYLLAH